jgi:DNA-binding beta-propeller fold protein YncE
MQYTLGATVGTVVTGGNVPGTSNTQLSYPIGMYFDALSNSLLIANYNSQTVVRWVLGASSWTLIAGGLNGLTSSTPILLSTPVGITLDPMGNLYVADSGNHRIQFFMVGQSSGKTIAEVSTTYGTFSSFLYTPYWSILDNQLNFYVVDTVKYRIQKFLHY